MNKKNDIKCMKILFMFTHVNVDIFFIILLCTPFVGWSKNIAALNVKDFVR